MEQVESAAENNLLCGENYAALLCSFSANNVEVFNLISFTEGTQWKALICLDICRCKVARALQYPVESTHKTRPDNLVSEAIAPTGYTSIDIGSPAIMHTYRTMNMITRGNAPRVCGIWEQGMVAEVWLQGVIIQVYKGKGSQSELSNYRVSTLLSAPSKVFAHVFLENKTNPAASQTSTTEPVYTWSLNVLSYSYSVQSLQCGGLGYAIDRDDQWHTLGLRSAMTAQSSYTITRGNAPRVCGSKFVNRSC